jgi:hypothetical protein
MSIYIKKNVANSKKKTISRKFNYVRELGPVLSDLPWSEPVHKNSAPIRERLKKFFWPIFRNFFSNFFV